MALGGLLAISDRRYRLGRVSRRKAAGETKIDGALEANG